FPWLKAGLADQSRLLIAEVAGNRNSGNSRQLCSAIHFAARNDLRQHRYRNAEVLQNFPIPRERVEVHQLRAAGIGHVSDVDSVIGSTGEMPDEKRIDIAKQQVAGFGLLACVRDIFENPANLQATEIGGQRKPGLGAITVLSAMRSELLYRGSHARVLPD